MKVARVAVLTLAWAIPAIAQDNPLDPKEATVPWEQTRPRDPVQDKSGKVWFVGQVGNYVAYLEPKTGQFKRFEIDPGANPHNINIDEKGGVWFTGNRNGKLYQIDPATGALTRVELDPTVRDPHTMIWDRNGIAWFTAQNSNQVGRLDRRTGEVKYWKTGDRSRPYGMVVDSKNRPWFDLFGTNKIGTVDPKTLEYKEYVLPQERARPRRIALTSDDAVWYGDYSLGVVGRLDPKTGKVEEYPLPGGAASLPYAMASDDQDRVWLAETGSQPNRLVAFDTKTKAFVANIPVPSNGSMQNTIRHMTYNRETRQLWFGTDAGTIGHINVPRELKKLVP